MAAPLIGVTGGRTDLGSFPGTPAALRHLTVDTAISAYAEKISEAGGVPVHLVRAGRAADALAAVHGLVIVGGGDVDPRRYGATPGPSSTDLDPGRDEHEIDLITGALARGVPILAICRGIQVLNVALGGTLLAHLAPDSGEAHSFLGYPPHHPVHRVSIRPDTQLHELLGPEAMVNSFHHQAVDRPGADVMVTATADDGVTEAVEVAGADVIGVQWHPEMMRDGGALFGWLTDRAVAYRSSAPRR